jgi:hypothetical protein
MTLPKPLPDVLCVHCELPYRHHDDFERCLFVPHEQYFREYTPKEWYARHGKPITWIDQEDVSA